MSLEIFLNLLSNFDLEAPNFPPTDFYNEGWLLRLVVDWFSRSMISDYPLSFPEDGYWYSEARLPSTFLPRFRGDPLGESHTNADGVIGHFVIGTTGKTDLELTPDATHLVVLEAKMYSGLSKGVTHAKYYDQAARYVACIAEVVRRADHKPKSFSNLSFYVIAPEVQIKSRTFSRHIAKKSINEKVDKRVSAYKGERDEWFKDWFRPTLDVIDIRSISWEELIDLIYENDSKIGKSISEFYSQCLIFNS